MADSGSSFPFTAVSVVVLFLTTTYLGQRAFDLWRQSDPGTGKELRLSDPPVEARLWEDPLEALGRHRQKLKEACRKDSDAGGGVANAVVCQMGQPIKAESFAAQFKDKDNVTVIAAVVPGAALVGAEEVRRRTRYAILAGLNAAGYVPDVSERIGLINVPRCEHFTGCRSQVPAPPSPMASPSRPIFPKAADAKSQVGDSTSPTDKPVDPSPPQSQSAGNDLPTASPTDVVFETLRAKNDDRRGVVVLWIDDTTIGQRWLSATAVMLRHLTAADAKFELRILGPAASDSLAKALGRDLDNLQREAVDKAGQKSDEFRKNWAALAKLKLISSLSTAPASEIRMAAGMPAPCKEEEKDGKRTDCVDKAFTERLQAIGRTADVDAPKSPFFVRTIGTDDVLVARLVDELRGRGIDPCGSSMRDKRIVLIGEWDSIYARTFGKTLENALQCSGSKMELQSYPYLRGLDGATLEGTTSQVRRTGEGSRESKTAPVEWPEGRGQADYVRRLVEGLLTNNDKKSVQAVGVIGWDVHDKLVLLQALRDAFPDRVLFTTDLDARLVHPSVSRYTRNVIVASSLALALEPWPAANGMQPTPQTTVTRFGQFRDSYQTAAFLAARLAVEAMDPKIICKNEDLEKPKGAECNIEKAVTRPSLFEIGREGAVELPSKGVAEDEKANRRVFAGVAFAVLAGAALMILFGYRAPAMKEVLGGSQAHSGAADPIHAALAVLQVAALGYAAGVVTELALPGSIGACGTVAIAVVSGLIFFAFVSLGTRRLVALVLGALVVATAWWFGPCAIDDIREPFAPLSGVSAWPSELLRVLAIVLFAWFLDEAWCRSANAAATIIQTYKLGKPQNSSQEGFRVRLREISVWFWKPQVVISGPQSCVNGAALWCEYAALLTGPARLVRILVWVGLSALLILGLYFVVNTLSDHAWPEIPARGASDQRLFSWTLAISSAAVLTLMIVVGDVTILTWRFVDMLKIGRTVYPNDTIGLFAKKLGGQVQEEASKTVAPNPEEREAAEEAGTACHNTLLDDWIDAKLLAEHTAEIGRLIVYPFILIALLVVARSRLFDNWDIGGAVLILLVGYMLWSIAMAALLNLSAERARRKALDGMAEDELWLKGASDKFDFGKVAASFSSMKEEVQTLRKGAFAPFFEQPLVQAILVPLGGAGGIQLLDWLLHARAQ